MIETNETQSDFTVEELKKISPLNFLAYFKLVEHLGKEVEKNTGIYFVIPIIQSAHESRNGNSELARNHCNLFGIVATDSWKKQGRPIALMPTWEVIKGKRVNMSREFRTYGSWKESFEDWVHIITNLNVYKKAYGLMKNKETAIEGITEMGKVYATDPAYTKKLLWLYREVSV